MATTKQQATSTSIAQTPGIYPHVIEAIGRTPLVRLDRVNRGNPATLVAKPGDDEPRAAPSKTGSASG